MAQSSLTDEERLEAVMFADEFVPGQPSAPVEPS
jgi:hypothetical protein